VVSLQNGVGNANTLRRALPGRDVRAGVVGFNVVAQGNGQFRRSTSGEIYVEAGPGALDKQLSVPGLSVVEASEIEPLQWGKLILNLTNAVNALSGLPLREMLLSRPWRRVLAAQMEEAMAVLRHAGIAFRIPAAAPARAIPAILRLPSWAFRRIAATMLTVDEAARTSMAIDLNAGRQTEIDQLQGEIIRLAVAHGMQAPVNARVAAAVDRAESAAGTGTGLAVSPQTLLAGAGSF